jgi:lipopolysaccharide export system permease protein
VLFAACAVLAVPLGPVNPRMGRSFNLLAAAFVYMVYSNGLNIVQSLIAQGKVDFWIGLIVPHALAILLVVVMFGLRLGMLPALRRSQAATAT